MLSPPFERAKDPDSDAHEFEYWSLLSPYPKIVPAEMLADKTSFLMPSFVLNSSPVQALSVMKISDPTGIFFNATITTVSGLFELTPVSMISPALTFPLHLGATKKLRVSTTSPQVVPIQLDTDDKFSNKYSCVPLLSPA